MGRVLTILLVHIISFVCLEAKIYGRCELAKELVNKYNFDKNEVGNWVCLAEHESSFNTTAIGGPDADGSYDHGLFQINDRYWCAPPEPANECGVTCEAIRTDDITEAVKCALKIYSVHGYKAWVAWTNECKDKNLVKYIEDCNL